MWKAEKFERGVSNGYISIGTESGMITYYPYLNASKAEDITDEMEKEIQEVAELIAAAPEMLEVLEIIENDNKQVPEWLWNRIKKVIKQARNGKV